MRTCLTTRARPHGFAGLGLIETVSGKRSRIQVDLPVPRGPKSRMDWVGVGSNFEHIDSYFPGNMHFTCADLRYIRVRQRLHCSESDVCAKSSFAGFWETRSASLGGLPLTTSLAMS